MLYSATLPRMSSMSRWQSIPISCRSFSDKVRNTSKLISSSLKMPMYLARLRSRRMFVTDSRCSSSRLTRGVPTVYGALRFSDVDFLGQSKYDFVGLRRASPTRRFSGFASGVFTRGGTRKLLVSTTVNAIGEMSGDLIVLMGEKLRFRTLEILACLYASNEIS